MSASTLSSVKPESNSLTRNIVTNSASYLITLGAAFLMFPVMIHKLGPARYGVWMLISELTGYYSYLGLGIRAGVVYHAALHLARGERRGLNEILSTAIWSLTALGGVLALSSAALANLFPVLFHTEAGDFSEISQAIVIMAFAVGISLPIEAMNSALTAAKRLDVASGIEMVTRAGTSVAMLICVLKGGGLVPLSGIQLASKVIAAPLTFVLMRRVMPELSVSLEHWKFSCLTRLARFGLPSMLIGIGWLVSSRTDLIVIGAALGLPMVAYYSIPRSLMEYADAGIRAMAWSFTSHLTHLHAEERPADMVHLYLRGSRLIGLAVFLLVAAIAVFGTSFLSLWQGAAFVTGPWLNRPNVVLLILLAGFLPRLMQNLASQLLYATNRLSFLMWLSLIEGAFKIALSIVLVKPFGLVGVALSSLVPMVLFEGVAIPMYLLRRYPIPLSRYWMDSIFRPLVTGAAVLAVGALLVFWRAPTNWGLFLVEALIASAAGVAIIAATGLTQEDRQVVSRVVARLRL